MFILTGSRIYVVTWSFGRCSHMINHMDNGICQDSYFIGLVFSGSQLAECRHDFLIFFSGFHYVERISLYIEVRVSSHNSRITAAFWCTGAVCAGRRARMTSQLHLPQTAALWLQPGHRFHTRCSVRVTMFCRKKFASGQVASAQENRWVSPTSAAPATCSRRPIPPHTHSTSSMKPEITSKPSRQSAACILSGRMWGLCTPSQGGDTGSRASQCARFESHHGFSAKGDEVRALFNSSSKNMTHNVLRFMAKAGIVFFSPALVNWNINIQFNLFFWEEFHFQACQRQ